MNGAHTIPVELPNGTVVEVPADGTVPSDAWAVMPIAHGAGAGREHPFLVGFADAMADAGVATLRFDFPYRAQGRRMPGAASHAAAAWNTVAAHVRESLPGLAVWLAGKSYGGRMASMAVADGLDADGLVYLGYPLHPPGTPEKARVEHLPRVVPRQLFLSGTNDPFVTPNDQLVTAVATCQAATLHWVDGGNHSFEVNGRRRPADEIGADLAPIVVDFLRG